MKLLIICMAALTLSCSSTKSQIASGTNSKTALKTGAERTEEYVPYLKGKRVAILANLTSIIGKTHLVDSLKSLGINVVKVFGPEHGFRGNASAGAHVEDEIDAKTGIPVISLYGKKNSHPKRIWLMLMY